MEEFAVGLVKVMEERLGPLGRPISTVLVVAIVLALIVGSVTFTWRQGVEPFIAQLNDLGVPHVAVAWGWPVLVALISYSIWLVHRRSRDKRMLEDLKQATGEVAHQITSEMIEEYRQETVQRFAELQKHLEERQQEQSR